MPVSPKVIGVSKATVPPSQGTDTGNQIVIPLPPSGVALGDNLYALAGATTSGGATVSPPAGWILVGQLDALHVWHRVATAAEPSSYTWTVSLANIARGGVIIHVRGGVNGAFATFVAGAGAMSCPNVTAGMVAGALWLGFATAPDTDNDEDVTTTGLHSLQAQHAGNLRFHAASSQAGLAAGQVVGSANVFIDAVAATGRRVASLIVDVAPTPEDLRRQTEVLAGYLPQGRAFGAKMIPGTVTRDLLEGLAQELIRSTDLVRTFRDEILSDDTVLLLPDWERALGIPDDCFTGTGTTEERRRDVLAKLASLGVQTAADFVKLAALFGVTAVIVAGSVHGVFPYTFPMVFFPDDRAARHTILVDLSAPTFEAFTYTFPLTLGSPVQGIVECLFRKVKPANVDLLFMDLP